MVDLIQTMLVTSAHLDTHLREALKVMDGSCMQAPCVPPFVRRQFGKTLEGSDEPSKRFAWLIAVCVCPAIQWYLVADRKDPQRLASFLGWLQPALQEMFEGKYSREPCEIVGFLSDAQVRLNTPCI